MRRLLVPLACAALFQVQAFAQAGESRPATPEAAASAAASAAGTVYPQSGLTLDAAVQTALRQNPLLRSFGYELESNDGAIRQAVVKVVGATGVIAGAALLESKGRPVLAHVIRGIAIAAWSAASWHNYRVARSTR